MKEEIQSSSLQCEEATREAEDDELSANAVNPTLPGASRKSGGENLASVTPQDSLLEETIGNFRLIQRLGGGGMATVYLAEHMSIGSKVAVKVLHQHLAMNPEMVARFYAEARAVNVVRHQNIVATYDIGALPSGRPYLVMEYLEADTLASLVGKPVDLAMLLSILRQICDALEAVHAHVVHRDLKPDNIFLVRREGREPTVKIADFGIAKLHSNGAGTQVGTVLGTPEYMAPEQFSGREVDRRTDIYALGVLAYQLATGQVPFRADSLMKLYVAHAQTPPALPRTLNPALPESLEQILLKALAKNPEDRFQTAGEMGAALASVPCSTGAPSPIPLQQPVSRSFQVKLGRDGHQALWPRQAVDLSTGGIFVCEQADPPPLFSRVRLFIVHSSGELACEGEVVRHVRPEEARAWGMEPGFAVQFMNTSPLLRKGIERLLRGQAPDQPTPLSDNLSNSDVERVLSSYPHADDPYALLGLAPDAECSDIQRRARATARELDALDQRPLSQGHRQRLETLRARLTAAMEAIGLPRRRAGHDAKCQNYRGVARCLAAGLTVTELEALRREFLERHPGAQGSSYVYSMRADSLLAKECSDLAMAELEKALELDPLDLNLHHRYWALRRVAAGSESRAGVSRMC